LSAGPARSYAAIAVAIVVAGVLISASLLFAFQQASKTTTFTTTSTSIVNSTQTESCDSSATLHCVVFQQTEACSNPEFWGIPWSVTVGAETEVQPPGTPLPLNNGSLSGTLNQNLTVLVFSLPDGSYHFRVSPANFFFTPDSGTVDVSGTNVLVRIAYTGTSCTTTVNSSAASSSSSSALIQPASGICLREVPQDSIFGSYSNSSSQGTTVTFPNGTEDFFPLNSCPVPVTHANFVIDSTIELDPSFIAAEHGYIYEATNACNCSSGGTITNPTGQQSASLNFVLYGNQRIYPCGPSSFWTYNQLGLIFVTIPISSDGSLQYSNAVIQWEADGLTVSCTTTQTG